MARPNNKPSPPPPPEVLALKELEGLVARITYENEDGSFKVVTIEGPGGKSFKAAGYFLGVGAGSPVKLQGDWKEHPKHGWTFQVQSSLVVEPTTEDALLAYLGSGLIKGIGPVTAKRIVEHFGVKTIETLDEAPELLTEVPKISSKKARQIAEQWAEHKAEREAVIFLKEHGLSNAIAMRLIRHYGQNAAAVLRTNPYRVGLEVRYIGFAKADEIAAKMGVPRDDPMRIIAAAVHLLDRASDEGHTFLPRAMLFERVAELIGRSAECVVAVLDDPQNCKFMKVEEIAEHGPCFFLPVLHACETGLAKVLASLLRSARVVRDDDVDGAIAAFEARYRFSLAPQQHDAIRSVASGGVCVITGGPGTGKTTLVRALLSVLKDDVRYALCSPTGRAAQRLSETTRQEAATVHRLLRWNAQTGTFVHNNENPLPLDLLIVDESSMLDVPLAFNLLRAVAPGATVVFVGDVDQLPSVGPGTFLRDLIESGRVKTTRLEHIFRQKQQSWIVANSHRINQGHMPKEAPTEEAEKSDFFIVERNEAEDLRDAAIRMVVERIPAKLHCDPVDDVQLLTPMRLGQLGTRELNRILQDRLNPDGAPLGGTSHLRIGDKVIQVANNYDLDVYNGDVGRVRAKDPDHGVRVVFGKRTVFYPLDVLDQLELAYALTIHKSQGSEYPAVVVLVHMSHFIMLRRNLLYTAMTRGKRLVVLAGNKKAISKAVHTSSETDRMTALRHWLVRPPGREEIFD